LAIAEQEIGKVQATSTIKLKLGEEKRKKEDSPRYLSTCREKKQEGQEILRNTESLEKEKRKVLDFKIGSDLLSSQKKSNFKNKKVYIKKRRRSSSFNFLPGKNERQNSELILNKRKSKIENGVEHQRTHSVKINIKNPIFDSLNKNKGTKKFEKYERKKKNFTIQKSFLEDTLIKKYQKVCTRNQKKPKSKNITNSLLK